MPPAITTILVVLADAVFLYFACTRSPKSVTSPVLAIVMLPVPSKLCPAIVLAVSKAVVVDAFPLVYY